MILYWTSLIIICALLGAVLYKLKWWQLWLVGGTIGLLWGLLFFPAEARADTTITLTPDQCISFVGPVYVLNLHIQLGNELLVSGDYALIEWPITPQLSKGLRHAFIGWLESIAKAGKGLSPLTHAQAFLTTCATEPVGEFVIAGDLI